MNIGVLGYLIFSIFTGGLESFSENYVFIGYVIFSTLTLPNLLSKVIFKSKLFGLSSSLLFAYFPVQFALQLLISYISGLSLSEILPFGVIFNLILWNLLFSLFILADNDEGNESEEMIKEILMATIPAILVTGLVFIFIRQQNSVIALDYLQHLTVPNRIFQNGAICILPGQCSNLFLQHGYTTLYHLILGNMTTFLGLNPIKAFFVLDMIFPIVTSIPIYMILKKVTRSTLWSQLGVLLSLLTFVMGGYDFVFFIPQTLALYFLILTIKEEDLGTSKLIPISILLIATHFILGTIFVGYLWFKYLVIEKLKTSKEKTIFLLLTLLSVIFFILANIAGFSIEKLFQEDALKTIGSATNAYYPYNLSIYIQNLGQGFLMLILAFFAEIFERKKNTKTLSIFAFIAFGLIFFMLAPTYANKFAIGIGFFSSFVVIRYLQRLGFKPITKILLFILLPILWGLNFFIQYQRYQTFYTQENGTISAIVEEDMELIQYLEENPLIDTLVISDPYTQLMVASLANIDTANAQYMSLETRQNLLSYLTEPNVQTYEQLITSPGVEGGKDIAIIYSSRIARTLELEDISWTYNIYSLPLNNSHNIQTLDKGLKADLERQGKEIVYISNNFILFK